jgi:hypothetical protein
MGLTPLLQAAEDALAQNQIAPSAYRCGRALGIAEDHDATIAVMHPID